VAMGEAASAAFEAAEKAAPFSLFLCLFSAAAQRQGRALKMDAPGKKEGQYSFLCLLA
jgi:hypothetical protein